MAIPVVKETYHTQCEVSLLYVFGITTCWTRTQHIVYDRFLLLLVLSCRLSPLCIWYHHLLDTNTTHCLLYLKGREDMTIPVERETYHKQCVMVVCNRW
jgi:hypothetical protein